MKIGNFFIVIIFLVSWFGFSTTETCCIASTSCSYTELLPRRVTCTVVVPDRFGGMIGISATAGNIFMGEEKAARKACEKVMIHAFKALGVNKIVY